MSSWLITLNDSAGKGEARRVLEELRPHLKRHKWSYSVLEDGGRDSLDNLHAIKALDSGQYRGILIIGGDGTVHRVANEVMEADDPIPFAVVPVGTGNDFARQCGLNDLKGEDLIRLFNERDPVRIDLLSVNGRYGLQVLSSGLDATVSKRARSTPKFLGPSRYLWAFLLTLSSKDSTCGRDYEISCDGQEMRCRALLVAVANGRNYGRGMLISPNSDNSDGVLEVIIIDPLPRWKLLLLFPRIFRGTHIHHPAVSVLKASRVRLRTESVIEMDGEAIMDGEVDLEITTRSAKAWAYR